MFRSLVREQEDLGWAPRPLAVLEMAVVRLASMPDGDDVGRLLARLDALEQRITGGGAAGGGGGEGSATTRPSRPARDARQNGTTHSAPARASAPPAEPEPPPPDAEHEPPTASVPLDTVFSRLHAFTERRNPRLAAALEDCSLLERGTAHIRMGAPNRFAAQRLESRREALEEISGEFFGGTMRVHVEQTNGTTAADANAQAGSERDRQARQRALEHPTVGLALEVLEGEIAEIRPLTSGAPGR